jgi:hypothetical protein
LYHLIAEKERATADDVRDKVIALNYQIRKIGLARWKYDAAKKKLDDWAKEKLLGEFIELPLKIQLHIARAELIDEVMAWHAAKVKLLEAQAQLADPGK